MIPKKKITERVENLIDQFVPELVARPDFSNIGVEPPNKKKRDKSGLFRLSIELAFYGVTIKSIRENDFVALQKRLPDYRDFKNMRLKRIVLEDVPPDEDGDDYEGTDGYLSVKYVFHGKVNKAA